MGRIIFWMTLWVITLGMLDIEAEYSDGLKIHLVGWPMRLARLFKKHGTK